MELDREQIKKALECCNSHEKCSECPCTDFCYGPSWFDENALAIINSQEQTIKELTEENERLHAQVKMWTATAYCEKDRAESSKADTVRRMHSLIKERCIKGGIYPAFVESTIEKVAKELLGGD